MNKKGFTLVELLAVIAILGVIATIGVASVNGISSIIKDNMLNKKFEIIEESALLYAENIRGSIINNSSKYNDYPCQSIQVKDLVPDYLDNDCEGATTCVLDPSDNTKTLDYYYVILYYKNKRIHAKVDVNNDCS